VTTYSSGRYVFTSKRGSVLALCRDENLDRTVCIHWVAKQDKIEAVRARLAILLSVASPFLALIYDMVIEGNRVGVVQEDLTDAVNVDDTNRLSRLYEMSAGLAALHDNGLAHGALDQGSFRMGPLNRGRLCNLAFGDAALDKPSRDYGAFAQCLDAMGISRVRDAPLQELRRKLEQAPSDPLTARLRDRIAALLLRDKHRALVYWRGTSVELSSQQRTARFSHPTGLAVVTIEYDGTRFYLSEAAGEVRVNNLSVSPGSELPGSCVLVLGGAHRARSERYSVTFDQSHPEVG
jgi:hypothetical protein